MIDTLQTLADTARTLRTTGHWSMNEVGAYLDRVIAYADQQERLYVAAVGTYVQRLDGISDAHVDEDWPLDQVSFYGQGKAAS